MRLQFHMHRTLLVILIIVPFSSSISYSIVMTPLMRAARVGNIKAMQEILTTNETMLKACDKEGKTALHHALYEDQEDAALYLINKNAPLTNLDNYDHTPLSLARLKKMDAATRRIGELLTKADERNSAKNQHFTILIASYNNAQWYRKNIESVLNQTYHYYTVIYMDDLSKDNTFNLAKNFVTRKKGTLEGWIFIKNTEKKYCLGNYLYAIERFCPDNTILVTLDGDDWLYDADVLTYLNKIYCRNPFLLLTYGQSVTYPQMTQPNFCRPIAKSFFKEIGKIRTECRKRLYWPIHHLRSFFAGLFRKINMADLLDKNGLPFRYTEDVAYMMPMIEMASYKHYRHIKKVLYVYNRSNPLITTNTVGLKAIHNKAKSICSKKPYHSLDTQAIAAIRS